MAFAHRVTRLLNGSSKRYFPRLLSCGHAKVVRAAVILLIGAAVIWTLRLRAPQPRQPSIYDYTDGKPRPPDSWSALNETARSDEVAFLDYLVHMYSLSNRVQWYAQRVQASYSAKSRPSMTEVSAKFVGGDFTKVRADDDNLRLRTQGSIKLPFTKSAKGHQVDASTLLFGISTTYSRLSYANNALIKDWKRWLTDGHGNSNGGNLLLTLHGATEDEMARAGTALHMHGIDATVLRSVDSGDATSRYVELVHLLEKHSTAFAGDRAKKYLALVDDDVFFPSMSKLIGRLAKFSPAEEYYIGAPSDRSDWIIENNSTFTCGGGAVFLTLPMAKKLTQLKCLGQDSGDDQQSRELAQWDLSLYDCVTTHSDARLQVLPSYHVPEDEEAYGNGGLSNEGYGAGIQPLTLHHYKNWHRFEAGRGHLVTSVCGEDCFLQRFRFTDDWIFINGYTISHYPDGVDAVPLRSAPKSSVAAVAAVTAAAGKLEDGGAQKKVAVTVGSRLVVDAADRPSDMRAVAWRGRRRTWRLVDARVVGGNGAIWQAYLKRKGGGNWVGDGEDSLPDGTVHSAEEKTDVDSLIVLIWEP